MEKLLTPIRRKILKIYGWILSIGLIYYGWILLTGRVLPCFYYTTTGLLCPGCGITRMFTAMLRLDFLAAFGYNPVVFCCFWFWNGIALLCFTGKIQLVQKPAFLYLAFGVTFASLVTFGILRNLL